MLFLVLGKHKGVPEMPTVKPILTEIYISSLFLNDAK